MTRTGTAARARRLGIPGLLLALVVTGTLPAWAGAASARPDPTTACPVAPSGTSESGRC